MAHENTIRLATVDDASEIARLSTELGYPTGPGEMRERLSRIIGNPAHHIAVAEGEHGVLAGWVHAADRFSLEAGAQSELLGMVVDAAARRQGIGASLLKSAELWSAERGLARMTVRSNIVRVSSHPFYESCGYDLRKTQKVYTKVL